MTEQKAIVVGGGIAGLTTAAALIRTGWRVQVLESAPELGEVGAGLAITVNGARALDAIGAGDRVRRDGYAVRPAGSRRSDGEWLLRAPDGNGLSRMIGIHRQRLHGALAESAVGAELVTGARVTSVVPGSPDGEAARVSWDSADGSHSARADLVVAADGIRSVVRGVVFPGHQLAYGGYSSWRAVVADTATVDDRFAMVWGPHAEFGALRISAEQVYWYGYVRLPAGHKFPDEVRAVREYFASWASDVRALTERAGPDELIRHDVWQLGKQLPQYAVGRVVLIGDAAHPMLPTLGQGANSALEDGVTVGAVFRPDEDLAGALRDYEAQRYRRTQGLVSRSAQMARVGAHLGPGLGQRVRNAMLRLTPAGLAARGGTRHLDWTPPVI
ncbi:FAD-binding monooxygenase [Kribbella capetownensis]|uniref:FAD-binding monooxygenase n=1 Tax=Kribbella capetownensis TaxID=1572659 RepID=A0A4R0JGT5_9ACTN|nr:FAD-dependent monooxygenase [Kribbella capetownensis]TCC43916.1 FAD-binding monooxygenase [Kribbella capetownensis]